MHKEESTIVKSKLENKNVEKTKHVRHRHNHHSNRDTKYNSHHHTKHHKKSQNRKVEAKTAKSEKHHTHKSHHKHRPRHYHHHRSTINTIEAKPQVPTQQPTENVSPSLNSGNIVSGLPRPLSTYYSIPRKNNPLPMSLTKITPTQPQQRPLTRSSLTNSLESSFPPTSPVLNPLTSPLTVLPLSPVYWGQPNNIPIENDPIQPYPGALPFYNSILSPFSRPHQTPFQNLQDFSFHPQNSDFDKYLKLSSFQIEHYWLSALYRIQELLNWLPFDDRKEIRKSLRIIITRHLHKQVPSISLDNPVSPNPPEKEALNVHIHLPKSDHKHTDTPSGALNNNYVMQKINEILSKLPRNSKEVHLDFPGPKNDKISESHNNHGNNQPQYSLDSDYLIPSKLASELDKTEILKRVYS